MPSLASLTFTVSQVNRTVMYQYMPIVKPNRVSNIYIILHLLNNNCRIHSFLVTMTKKCRGSANLEQKCEITQCGFDWGIIIAAGWHSWTSCPTKLVLQPASLVQTESLNYFFPRQVRSTVFGSSPLPPSDEAQRQSEHIKLSHTHAMSRQTLKSAHMKSSQALLAQETDAENQQDNWLQQWECISNEKE